MHPAEAKILAHVLTELEHHIGLNGSSETFPTGDVYCKKFRYSQVGATVATLGDVLADNRMADNHLSSCEKKPGETLRTW